MHLVPYKFNHKSQNCLALYHTISLSTLRDPNFFMDSVDFFPVKQVLRNQFNRIGGGATIGVSNHRNIQALDNGDDYTL